MLILTSIKRRFLRVGNIKYAKQLLQGNIMLVQPSKLEIHLRDSKDGALPYVSKFRGN